MGQIVCAAFIDFDRVLFVRRAAHRKWSADKWDLVGGHVEKGEELDVALVRECQEEVGLTPRAFDLVTTLFEEEDSERKSPFHIFRISVWEGSAARLLGHEHSELAWFGVEELVEVDLAFEGYRDAVSPLLQNQLTG